MSESDPDRPVILEKYRDITEAMVDKTTLESAGIPCYLFDDNLVRLDWFISNAIGGVKVVVRASDLEEARSLLAQAKAQAEATPEGEPDEETPRE